MTTTAIAPPALVTGAARQARPYGLFSVVAFPESSGAPRFEAGGVQWERLACSTEPTGLGVISGAVCGADVPGLPKSLDESTAGLGAATAFTVYGWHNCSPVGWTPSQAQDRAAQHLSVHEERAVEYVLWTGHRGASPSFLGSAANVTGDAAVPSAIALGALERAAADYGSLPVLHIGVETAHVLFSLGLLTVRAGRCFTMTGVPVVIGSGYPGTGPVVEPPSGMPSAPATEQWGYMTPPLFGYRSEVFTSSATSGDLLDRRTNDLYAVAERTYTIGFDDCGVGAALFDLSAA